MRWKKDGGWIGWGRREDLSKNPHRSNASIPSLPRSAFLPLVDRDLRVKGRDEIRSGTSEESRPGDYFRRLASLENPSAERKEASSEILGPKGEADDWLEKVLEAFRSAAEARASDFACQKKRSRAFAEDTARCCTFGGIVRPGIPEETTEKVARRTLGGERKEPSPNA